jgi:hypothetical protein
VLNHSNNLKISSKLQTQPDTPVAIAGVTSQCKSATNSAVRFSFYRIPKTSTLSFNGKAAQQGEKFIPLLIVSEKSLA